MGRLKHYQNCDVVIAQGDTPELVADQEDGMVHQELKNCNTHNGLKKQDGGKRFLTDNEIKILVEQFVRDDEIIAQTYEEISKRRKDKNFQYSLVKQGVSMTIVSRFCDMGIARPSAMKLAMGVVNILYDLYVAECQVKQRTEKEDGSPVAEIDANLETPENDESGELKKEVEADNKEKISQNIRKIMVSPKSITLENAVIEAGKIKSLMEMMDSYYYDYLSADASEKMQSFYCVFDILKKRYEEFEEGLQHVIYG
ncbi:MAG: hypothetical protein ACI4EO_01845 [Blautia sp.]